MPRFGDSATFPVEPEERDLGKPHLKEGAQQIPGQVGRRTPMRASTKTPIPMRAIQFHVLT